MTQAQDAFFEGDVTGAIDLCRHALEANEEDGEAYKFLARILLDADRFDEGASFVYVLCALNVCVWESVHVRVCVRASYVD